MIYTINYQEMMRKINPYAFSKYLEDTGWEQFPWNRKNIRVYQKEQDEFYQATIPMEDTLSDYDEAMLRACNEVAKCEQKPLEEILLYLLNPNADNLKIRVEKASIDAGSMLMDDAIGVYENAKNYWGRQRKMSLSPHSYIKGEWTLL